jgi:hypothetical protein
MALQRLFALLTCSFMAAFQLARSAMIFAWGDTNAATNDGFVCIVGFDGTASQRAPT